MNFPRRWAIVVVAGWLASLACAQSTPAEPASPQPPASPPAVAPADPAVIDVNALLEPIRSRYRLPALGGAIVTTKGLAHVGAVGVRKAGGEERVTTDDLWHIGSCTKAMTATMIATLVQDGTLSWGVTLAEAFPDVEMHEEWRGVTLTQLLTHRAGFAHGPNAPGLWVRLRRHTGTPVEQRRLMLVETLKLAPEFEPGTKMQYSNTGFGVAGVIAETETKTPWEDLMRGRLFHPLGMTSAGFGAPGTPGAVDQPWGHTAIGTPIEPGPNADNPAAIGPGGTVRLSLRDWAQFVALHLREAAPGEPAVVTAESLALLHTPPHDGFGDYAFGWSVGTRGWAKGDAPGDTGRTLSHNGTNTLWYAVTWLAPERGFAVLVATNQGGDAGAKATDDAAAAMIRAYRSIGAPPKPEAPR
ncbi:MAG: serine hydrolase domain-containing protein [Phycisphaerales bacterium]